MNDSDSCSDLVIGSGTISTLYLVVESVTATLVSKHIAKPDDANEPVADLWISVKNKKESKKKDFEKVALKIIDQIEKLTGETNKISEIQQTIELLREKIAEENESRSSEPVNPAGVQLVKQSGFYKFAIAAWNAHPNNETAQELKMAVIQLLLINQNILSLARLRKDVEKIGLFHPTDPEVVKAVYSQLETIYDIRNKTLHVLDTETPTIEKETLTEFFEAVRSIDGHYATLLANDDITKEELKTLKLLLDNHSELIDLPKKLEQQKEKLRQQTKGELETIEVVQRLLEDRKAVLSNSAPSGQNDGGASSPADAETSGMDYFKAEKVEDTSVDHPSDDDGEPVSQSTSSMKPELLTEFPFSTSPGEGERKGLVLRDYQEEVAQRPLDGKNDIILLPTGAGKTYVAIKVIIKHIEQKSKKAKVAFVVPTTVLAKQQLRKIKEYLVHPWNNQCRTITGDDKISPEELKQVITEDKFVVLVVTPAIIANYFNMHKDASLSRFSLLIFDEFHHAKKDHPYNVLIGRCIQAQDTPNAALPQLIGLTATIGVGDSSILEGAEQHVLEMCAKFGLKEPPSQSSRQLELAQYETQEEYVELESWRDDRMTHYLQKSCMEPLEVEIASKLSSPLFKKYSANIDAQFPTDRCAQTYEAFIIDLKESRVPRCHEYEELRSDAYYCIMALNHLLAYYKAVKLTNLLNCAHGLRDLQDFQKQAQYQSISEIKNHLTERLAELANLAEEEDKNNPNPKVRLLKDRLTQLFTAKPKSKVIIFVKMRAVAVYLTDLLNQHRTRTFQAKEFTSTGPSSEDKGMKPQQMLDAREGFEGSKYNILVATSVLEEGIDIQACNMVIRYMYVKDMIAKIQSRGRARQAGGVMLAMLDEKLLEQERKNDAKERLMYKALRNVRAMSADEFGKRVDTQWKLLVQAQTTNKPSIPQQPHQKPASVKVSCKMCGSHLGDMANVRKLGDCHYLILDANLHEAVTFSHRKEKEAYDGMTACGSLCCKGRDNDCVHKVGNLFRMKSDTNKVIEKWGNMRDSFRKSAAKMATKSGDAAKKVTPYKYFEQMRWLLDYNKPRHTTSNITLTNVENGEENDDDDDEENSPPPPIPRRKRKSSAVGEQILQQISSTGNIIKDMAGEKYSKEKAFGQVMADMIEEIPEGYDRDMLKLDIHKLILERKHKYMALESYRE